MVWLVTFDAFATHAGPFLMMSLMQAAGKKMAALVGFSQLFKC